MFRVFRLAFLAFFGVVLPYVAGLHGLPTVASIEAAVIVAGETAFRQVFPLIEADLQGYVKAGPATTAMALKTDTPPAAPPAVY